MKFALRIETLATSVVAIAAWTSAVGSARELLEARGFFLALVM